MAEELQSLLEKINQDGIMKAQAEKEVIIADARKEAKVLLPMPAKRRKISLPEQIKMLRISPTAPPGH